MLITWYFVIAFCSVYKNSNKELLYGTLISFTISNIILRVLLSLINVFFRSIAKCWKNK